MKKKKVCKIENSSIRVANRGGAGREKKFQNHQDCKFCVNEIKYLQLLILEKWIFSHDR